MLAQSPGQGAGVDAGECPGRPRPRGQAPSERVAHVRLRHQPLHFDVAELVGAVQGTRQTNAPRMSDIMGLVIKLAMHNKINGQFVFLHEA